MSFWRPLWTVMRKELRDNLRDTRVRSAAMILPLLGPVLFFTIFSGMIADKRGESELVVAVRGTAQAPDLVNFLRQNGVRVEPTDHDLEVHVRTHSGHVAVEIAEDYSKKFSSGGSASVALYADSSNQKSQVKAERIARLLRGYSEFVGMRRLLARGVSPELATPVQVGRIDVATAGSSAARALSIIPMFLLVVAFVGGMHLAIDATAGERERGSLEPLLLNPASRAAILAGKWAAAAAAAGVALAVCLAGYHVATGRLDLSELGISVELDIATVFALWGLMLPLGVMASALQLLLSLYARSNKEAQTYLQFLLFLPMVVGVILVISPLSHKGWMMALPMLSQELLASSLVGGDAVTFGQWFTASAVTLTVGLISFGAAVRLLGRESTVYGRSA